MQRQDTVNELSASRRKLVVLEQKCVDLLAALEEQEMREINRSKADSETRLCVDQQYTYLAQEYEGRIRDLEYDRKRVEDEVY